MKKILIVSCTRHSDKESPNLEIVKSVEALKDQVDLKIHFNNTDPLPKVYNSYITKEYSKLYDYIVFAHDDLYIDDLKLRDKIIHNSTSYDIIGLAGCLNPRISKPALWHLMAERSDHRGYVAHNTAVDGVYHMTSFGPTPSRVAVIDGLFIAVNLKSILKAKWKFNINFSFHHYDIASCIDANRRKLKIGVAPINVIHKSPGLLSYNDSSFQASENKFMTIYGK